MEMLEQGSVQDRRGVRGVAQCLCYGVGRCIMWVPMNGPWYKSRMNHLRPVAEETEPEHT